MSETITTRTARQAVIGWTVTIGRESVDVDVDDLPAPGFPTIHQILHTARAKAQGMPADRVALALATDAAHELALANWEQSESIRRDCVRLSGIDWRKVSRIENAYLDHSTVIGFDSAAKSAASEIPELGWDPEADNGAALWEIVSRRPMARPKRTDDAIVNDAIAAVTQVAASSASAEVVPF